MMTSGSRKKTTNILIINQLVLDILACFFLVVTIGAQFHSTYFSGPLGNFICYVIDSELLTDVCLLGSIANLVMITLERYAKIVYPIAHRKYYKQWMTYAAVIISWVNGIFQNFPVILATAVVQGQCYVAYFWSSVFAQVLYITFEYQIAMFC